MIRGSTVEHGEEYADRLPPIFVRCGTFHEWIDESTVEVLNIEEGPMGEDILTFICPKCGETHKSTRVK